MHFQLKEHFVKKSNWESQETKGTLATNRNCLYTQFICTPVNEIQKEKNYYKHPTKYKSQKATLKKAY